MEIRIKDEVNGKVYSNDMSDKNKQSILEIHFCTSYTQVKVQDTIETEQGNFAYPEHDIILPPLGSKVNWVDLIATQYDNKGHWLN